MTGGEECRRFCLQQRRRCFRRVECGDPDHGRVLVALNARVTPVDEARRQFVARQLGEVMLLAMAFLTMSGFFAVHGVASGWVPARSGC